VINRTRVVILEKVGAGLALTSVILALIASFGSSLSLVVASLPFAALAPGIRLETHYKWIH
jgi:hypothetical protein